MSDKKKPKRKKSLPKAKARAKRPSAKKAVKAKTIVQRQRIGVESAASLASKASLEAAVAPVDDGGIPIDFELKVEKPESNIAPAIRVVVGAVSTDVPLQTSDQETWFGGISAAAGTQLQIFASARVKTGGSMTLSIKEPGFIFPPITTNPVGGLCAMGPLPYPVG